MANEYKIEVTKNISGPMSFQRTQLGGTEDNTGKNDYLFTVYKGDSVVPVNGTIAQTVLASDEGKKFVRESKEGGLEKGSVTITV